MKCKLCGTENDISTNITTCVKCGSDLPYSDISFIITDLGTGKVTSGEGRIAIDVDRLAFNRKSRGKQSLALGAFGLVGKALYDQHEKGNGAYRIYNRSDFTEIQKVANSFGALNFYMLTTPEEQIKIIPATRKMDLLIESMDRFSDSLVKASPVEASPLQSFRSHGK